jgi:SAM-dependent methyltransferase
MTINPERTLQRRVAGYHDYRMDGLTDLLLRARGASVLDVGCNRGLVCLEFAHQGASSVTGVDNYAEGIETARQLFADLRNVSAGFACVDLTEGPTSLEPLGKNRYDIVITLATCHKIRRVMDAKLYSDLMRDLGARAIKYFAWRATSDKPAENDQEMKFLDTDLGTAGLKRIHTSYISHDLGVAAIWERY